MTLQDSAIQLLMLLVFGWASITLLFSMVGQGAFGYLLITYIRNKYYYIQDNKDAQIDYLNALLIDKTKAEEKADTERNSLMHTLIKYLGAQLNDK